jgi:hypothetical protein
MLIPNTAFAITDAEVLEVLTEVECMLDDIWDSGRTPYSSNIVSTMSRVTYVSALVSNEGSNPYYSMMLGVLDQIETDLDDIDALSTTGYESKDDAESSKALSYSYIGTDNTTAMIHALDAHQFAGSYGYCFFTAKNKLIGGYAAYGASSIAYGDCINGSLDVLETLCAQY